MLKTYFCSGQKGFLKDLGTKTKSKINYMVNVTNVKKLRSNSFRTLPICDYSVGQYLIATKETAKEFFKRLEKESRQDLIEGKYSDVKPCSSRVIKKLYH
jgi:hypothetical protein